MFHFGYAMFQTVSVPWLSFKVQFTQAKQRAYCTLKNAIRPYPETGSHQQMSLRKKEDSDTENAP